MFFAFCLNKAKRCESQPHYSARTIVGAFSLLFENVRSACPCPADVRLVFNP
jgi:hypothetical protein